MNETGQIPSEGPFDGVPPVQFARTPAGEHVAYQTFGQGPAIHLLFHEWAASIDAVWEHPAHLRFWRVRAQLAHNVLFDPRGIGPSDPASPDRIGSLDEWVTDAVAVLDDLGLDRIAVSAEGFGSHAGIRFTAEHPERVESLLLGNPYSSLSNGPGRAWGTSPADIDQLADTVRSAWGTGAVLYASAPGLGTDPSFRELLGRLERTAASPATAAAWVRAQYTSDVTDLLPEISVPVLVLRTGDFPYIPREATLDVVERIADARLVDTPSTGMYWFDDPAIIAAYSEFIGGADAASTGDRVLATVLLTDVVDSTAKVAELGDLRWTEVLSDLDRFVRHTVDRFGGAIVKQTGDGHLATFDAPTDALKAGLAVRAGVPTFGLEVRIGVHTGEIERRPAGDIGGIGVHVAARITAMAEGSEILVSGAVPLLVAGAGFQFADRGEHDLRGVPGEWQVLSLAG